MLECGQEKRDLPARDAVFPPLHEHLLHLGQIDATRDVDVAVRGDLGERSEDRHLALREAERSVRDARSAVARAEAWLKKAAARAKQTEKTKAAIEQQLEKATTAADEARRDARRIREQSRRGS